MPQLGETVTEGTIIKWLKHPGDSVALDEPLFEVSTDKVDSEVPSPFAGVLSQVLVEEGETVEVGTRLAVIDGAGTTTSPVSGVEPTPEPPPQPESVPPPPPVAAPPTVTEVPTPVAEASAPERPPIAPPPPAEEPALLQHQEADVEEPALREQQEAEVVSPDLTVPSSEPPEGDGARRRILSPVVRRLIRESGLDPSQISGTGAGGRITRDDVLARLATAAGTVAVAAKTAAPAQTTSPAYVPPQTQPMARPAVSAPPAPIGVRDEVVPFSAVRRITAEHMVRSINTSVHTLVAIEADFENVERVRSELKEQFRAEEGMSLTYLPFVARAVVDVLHDYPNLNSSVGNDALVIHHDINLGIAVDLQKEGLIVPVIRNADGQSLRGIARSIADLASRARSRKLSTDDIAGGTFTITNPGPFGTFITAPIIAQPQVAILSTDGVKRKPVVMTAPDGSESIAIHSVGVLALVFDHRAIDGAYASSFVRDVAAVIETRDWRSEL